MALNKKQEEDDVPLVQYLLESKKGYFNRISPPVMKLNTQKLPLHRRPSCPTTPLSLLDTFSDDEDDEDLVPIGFITAHQQRKGGQLQSAAEKYKEKVKAQLNDINILVDDDDDDVPLSKSCFFI